MIDKLCRSFVFSRFCLMWNSNRMIIKCHKLEVGLHSHPRFLILIISSQLAHYFSSCIEMEPKENNYELARVSGEWQTDNYRHIPEPEHGGGWLRDLLHAQPALPRRTRNLQWHKGQEQTGSRWPITTCNLLTKTFRWKVAGMNYNLPFRKGKLFRRRREKAEEAQQKQVGISWRNQENDG